MKTTLIYSSTDHLYLFSSNAVYATAHANADGYTQNGTNINAGQLVISNHNIFRGLLKFPTSDIPDDAYLIGAQFRGTVVDTYVSKGQILDLVKQPSWEGYDFGTTDLQQAWTECAAAPLDVAWHRFDYDGSSYLVDQTYYSPNLDLSWISTTDYTYYSLVSRDDRNSVPSTADDLLVIWSTENANPDYRPALLVSYSEEPASYTGIAYELNINWGGTFTSTDWDDEAGRVIRWASNRGKDTVFGSGDNGLMPPMPGKLIIDLDNYDGRYDPYNASSPLYGLIRPGKKVNFSCWYDGTYYDIFTGIIETIRPAGWRDVVTLTVGDGASWLQSRVADIQLFASTSVDVAMGAILDDLAYPFGRDLDTGLLGQKYFWSSNKNALTELHELAASEGGRFSVDANGAARYNSAGTSDAIITTITEDEIGKNILVSMPWEYSFNNVDVYVYPYQIGSTDSTIFTLREDIVVSASTSFTFWAEYRYDDQNVPVDGAFLSSYQPTTAFPSTNVNITYFSKSAKIELVNPTTDSHSLTELILKGTPIYSPDPIKIRKSSTSSFAENTLRYDYPWMSYPSIANSFADIALGYFEQDNRFVEIEILNRPDLAFLVDLEDKVVLQIDTFGINSNYYVNKIDHRSGITPQEVITRIKLYPALN